MTNEKEKLEALLNSLKVLQDHSNSKDDKEKIVCHAVWPVAGTAAAGAAGVACSRLVRQGRGGAGNHRHRRGPGTARRRVPCQSVCAGRLYPFVRVAFPA